MLIPPYYAASGGEYTQKRLNFDSHNTDIFNLNLQGLITQLKNIKKSRIC
ncbi:hypothetical protein [Rickettsia endosymbiont of Gonocerus acuteangulatus]